MTQIPHCPEGIDAKRLEQSALLLMSVNQHWHQPDHAGRLQSALDISRQIWRELQSVLSGDCPGMSAEMRNNLLIVSVYAEGKLDEIAETPDQDKIASLINMTRSLALSLRDWRSAA